MREVGRRDDHAVETGRREKILMPCESFGFCPGSFSATSPAIVSRASTTRRRARRLELARLRRERLVQQIRAAASAADDPEIDAIVGTAAAATVDGRRGQADASRQKLTPWKSR